MSTIKTLFTSPYSGFLAEELQAEAREELKASKDYLRLAARFAVATQGMNASERESLKSMLLSISRDERRHHKLLTDLYHRMLKLEKERIQ